MKSVTQVLALLITMFISAVGNCQSLDEAHAAMKRRDYPAAIRAYLNASEHSVAQNNLGVIYRDGLGVARNDTGAVLWFRRSAEQGDAYGQHNLGRMYSENGGASKSDSIAIDWFRKSAEQGYPPAQAQLGYRYARGLGVEKNDTLALSWFLKSANQGDALAQSAVGAIYADGLLVQQDWFEARMWFVRAAAQGFTAAKAAVAKLDTQGLGLPRRAVASTVNAVTGQDQTSEIARLKADAEASRQRQQALEAQLNAERVKQAKAAKDAESAAAMNVLTQILSGPAKIRNGNDGNKFSDSSLENAARASRNMDEMGKSLQRQILMNETQSACRGGDQNACREYKLMLFAQ